MYTVMYMVPIGKSESGIKYDFLSFSGLKGYEVFDEAYSKIDYISQRVIDLFDAKPVVPGDYEIICDPSF